MKIGVVVFPHSSNSEDMKYVLQDIMDIDVVSLWYNERNLHEVDAIIINSDVHANCLTPLLKLPIIEEIVKYAHNGGFIFGISGGFKLLCDLNLLPGKIMENPKNNLIGKDIYLKIEHSRQNSENGFALKIPVAHKFGRYNADAKILKKLNYNGQILFRYCDANGRLKQDANPNNSIANIAGICNAGRNVFGLMPYPERAFDEELGNTDGKYIFEMALRTIMVDYNHNAILQETGT